MLADAATYCKELDASSLDDIYARGFPFSARTDQDLEYIALLTGAK